MSMSVRQLIEHLAQFEPEYEVMVRDQERNEAFFPIEPHDVWLETLPDQNKQMVVVVG